MRSVWLSILLGLLVVGQGEPVVHGVQSCAWILWKKAAGPIYMWEVMNSYATRGKCQDKLKKSAEKLAQPTDMIDVDGNRATVTDLMGTTIFYTLLCLPDTIAPGIPIR